MKNIGIDNGQVKNIANYVATSDKVVAFLPKGLECLAFFDVGGAGHSGFKSEEVNHIAFVKGGHDAAIKENNWDEITKFLLTGGRAKIDKDLYFKKQPTWLRLISKIPLLAPVIIICILGGGLVALHNFNVPLSSEQWMTVFSFLVYYLVIRFLLMKW